MKKILKRTKTFSWSSWETPGLVNKEPKEDGSTYFDGVGRRTGFVTGEWLIIFLKEIH